MKEKMKSGKSSKYIPLAGSDFSAPPVPKDQAIALIFGLPGHGKTTFGLSGAPGPVAFFDIDKRGRHAAAVAQKNGKIVHYLPMNVPKKLLSLKDQNLKLLAAKEVAKLQKNVEITAREGEKGNIRTAVFDTVSELGGIINMSVTGRVDAKKDDFGKSTHIVKGIVKDIIETYRSTDVNVIFLARAKEIWVGRESTGKYRHEGLDTFEYEADWAGHIRLAKDKKTKLRRSQDHELEITKAGIDIAQLGEVYLQEEWEEDDLGPFVFACLQNYPDSEVESWT